VYVARQAERSGRPPVRHYCRAPSTAALERPAEEVPLALLSGRSSRPRQPCLNVATPGSGHRRDVTFAATHRSILSSHQLLTVSRNGVKGSTTTSGNMLALNRHLMPSPSNWGMGYSIKRGADRPKPPGRELAADKLRA